MLSCGDFGSAAQILLRDRDHSPHLTDEIVKDKCLSAAMELLNSASSCRDLVIPQARACVELLGSWDRTASDDALCELGLIDAVLHLARFAGCHQVRSRQILLLIAIYGHITLDSTPSYRSPSRSG